MIVKGTYFQNSEEKPLVYGDVEIHNIPRRRLRGEEEKEGIIAESVFVGFCGTDSYEYGAGREFKTEVSGRLQQTDQWS